MKTFAYQIYYDDKSFQQVQSGFIPLDNSQNARPDWFELWVILNFLRHNTLEDDSWYGFVSPKFTEKTGVTADYVLQTLTHVGPHADVALFSPAWDQIAFYLNPWEQGDVWHQGLMALSQAFVNHAQISIDLSTLVTDSTSSLFSNYMFATKRFWLVWQALAEKCFAFFESGQDTQIGFASDTAYGLTVNRYPMKTFVQERMAALILATHDFKTVTVDQSATRPIFTRLFPDNLHTRRLLQTCDLMKHMYRQTKEATYLEMYWRLRKQIQYTPPAM
jgi:hypothetical protein